MQKFIYHHNTTVFRHSGAEGAAGCRFLRTQHCVLRKYIYNPIEGRKKCMCAAHRCCWVSCRYHGAMPWLAIPFEDRDAKAKLSAKYGVTGIPTLVLVDGATGETIAADADERITRDGAKGFPWK